MSNIFDALERAQRERNGSVKVEIMPLDDIQFEKNDLLPKEPVHPGSSKNGAGIVTDDVVADLYWSILELLPDRDQLLVQFASSQPGEGVSTIVNEFARITAERFGKRVLLVNAVRSFGNAESTSDVRVALNKYGGMAGLAGAACFQANSRNLWVATLPVGEVASSRLGDLASRITSLKGNWQEYDLVLFDCPPLMVEPDGFELARFMDGVILVLEAERTKRSVVENVKERIVRNGGNMLGVVFNKRRHHIPACIRNWLH